MGALNHSQNLFKFRPWELTRNIFYDIFSIEMPTLKIETIKNMDIIRVSPLMIEGYRFLLSDCSRYSYMFFNYNPIKNLYVKTNQLLNLKINWKKLIIFLQYICIFSLSTVSYLLLLNFVIFNFINENLSFFSIFFIDSVSLVNLKILFNFTNKVFGYNNLSFSQNIPLNILNNVSNFCFEHRIFNNFFNLEITINNFMNFYLCNFMNILNISENLVFFNNIIFDCISVLILTFVYKIFLNKNFKITSLLLFKSKVILSIYKFFDCRAQLKNLDNFFFCNFNNFSNLNLSYLFKINSGITFLNNNTDYNLSFLGYKKNTIDINKNFVINDFLCLFDISSFINWFDLSIFKNVRLKIFNLNLIIAKNNFFGLTIPFCNIMTLKENIFFNSYNDLTFSKKQIQSSYGLKDLNIIIKTLWKTL